MDGDHEVAEDELADLGVVVVVGPASPDHTPQKRRKGAPGRFRLGARPFDYFPSSRNPSPQSCSPRLATSCAKAGYSSNRD